MSSAVDFRCWQANVRGLLHPMLASQKVLKIDHIIHKAKQHSVSVIGMQETFIFTPHQRTNIDKHIDGWHLIASRSYSINSSGCALLIRKNSISHIVRSTQFDTPNSERWAYAQVKTSDGSELIIHSIHLLNDPLLDSKQ